MRAFTFIVALLLGTIAFAAPTFPSLTGRVVDDAHVLSASTVQILDQMLADYEHGTSSQVVVVTVASLQGISIEDYGYQLGRTWQIGQKDKNNGALLIVAPKEKKVRIEVGYGLEPVLTDAAASEIVNGIILPEFRNDQMEQGVINGTRAILDVLGGKSVPTPDQTDRPMPLQVIFSSLIIVAFFGFALRNPFFAMLMLFNSSSRFGSSRLGDYGGGFSGGGFGGGFSGDGGSFGGGGASGSW